MTRLYAGLTIAAMLVVAGIAYAHGDAEWIMREPRYVMKSGVHCCGPADCERMPAEVRARLKPIEKGWELDGVRFFYGERGMYQSIDSDWWWCRLPDPKCIFEPMVGA